MGNAGFISPTVSGVWVLGFQRLGALEFRGFGVEGEEFGV